LSPSLTSVMSWLGVGLEVLATCSRWMSASPFAMAGCPARMSLANSQ